MWNWPDLLDLFQGLNEADAVYKLIVAAAAIVVITVLQKLWRLFRLHVWTSTPDLIAHLTRDLEDETKVHASNVAFMSRNNILLSWILFLGFLYVGGSNLEKYSHTFEVYIVEMLKVFISPVLVDILRSFARDIAAPALFWILAFLLARYCTRFYRFNRHHRDFAAYKAQAQASLRTLRARVTPEQDVPVKIMLDPQEPAGEAAAAPAPAAPRQSAGPSPADKSTAPGAVEIQRERGPVKAKRLPEWRLGTVVQWPDGGWFGFIEGGRPLLPYETGGAVAEGAPRYWTNHSRLVTTTPPQVGQEVVFIRHPEKFKNENDVAVLVATMEQPCEGVLRSRPGANDYRFAEITDFQGNSAEILVLPPRGDSIRELPVGTRVTFRLGRNDRGPIGRETRTLE